MAPRSGGAKSGGALPNLRILCPKTAFFGPKRPRNPVIIAKRRQTVPTLHVRHQCPVNISPFLPSSSTICSRNGPRMAKNGLTVRYLCPTQPKPRTGRILGYVAQNQVPRAPIAPATLHFLWFPSLRIAQRDSYTLVPVLTLCSRRAAQPAHSGSQRWVHRGPRGEKIIFFKVVPRPLGMLKQVFLARFEPVVARFGPRKIPKCLENGPFWDQKWLKNGSKTRFPKSDPGPFGMLKQVFLTRLEPVVPRFDPWKIPKCLEKGPVQHQKCVKNGSKTHFSESDPGQFGMLKQVILAHFEPFLIEFSPFCHMYAPRCALRT